MKKKFIAALACVLSIASFSVSYADGADETAGIKEKIENIKESSSENYDVQAAAAALYEKLTALEEKYSEDKEKDIRIENLTKKIDEMEKEREKALKQKQEITDYLASLKENPSQKDLEQEHLQYDAPRRPTKDYIVSVPDASRANNYIQDGANAQGYARMVFAYGPEQVYKIYCKIGYLTDIKFMDGESISYVGGGDTAQWMIDHASVNGTSHLYVKPIANNIATNVIVNTDKGHIYQILLNSGSWFNPMVAWSYGNEEIVKKQIKAKEESSYISSGSISPENINFNYKIKAEKGLDFKPEAVFDDKKRTYIKFKDLKALPVLFVKDKSGKKLILANYKTSGSTFIVDTIFDEAVLKLDQDEAIILRKG